jgi:hypothetical protein
LGHTLRASTPWGVRSNVGLIILGSGISNRETVGFAFPAATDGPPELGGKIGAKRHQDKAGSTAVTDWSL